jgi:mycothiol synthase
MSSELRPPTLDDVPALAELSARRFNGMSEVQIRERLGSPRSRADENWRVAVDERGEIVGGTFIWHPEGEERRVFAYVTTYPEDASLYERLLDWTEERAAVLTDRDARLGVSAGSEDELLADILRRRGFELVRHFFTMEIDLTHAPPLPAWPAGIEIRVFQPGEERAIYDVDLEAFQDHWDSFSIPFEEWREYFLGSSTFDPGLWWVAEEGGEIAGTALCTWESRPGIGRVNVLAVRRPWRRRGLGRSLLLQSFHEFRRRGRTKVDLNVDAENLTGAVRLYESAGMHVAHREDSYHKEVS